MTRDLNAGEVPFITELTVTTGGRFKISSIKDSSHYHAELTGTIIRCGRHKNGSIIAGKFDDVPDKDREKIASFIQAFEALQFTPARYSGKSFHNC